jgi:hypothetical protein
VAPLPVAEVHSVDGGPAEYSGVQLEGALHIRRPERVPAERVGHVDSVPGSGRIGLPKSHVRCLIMAT